MPAMTAGKPNASWRWPAVVTRLIGRHRLSAARWILLVSPPRDRPIASREGLVARFLSFARAPCVHIQRRDDLRGHVGRWKAARAGGVLMGPHDRSVHPHRPVSAFGDVGTAAQLIQDPLVGSIA